MVPRLAYQISVAQYPDKYTAGSLGVINFAIKTKVPAGHGLAQFHLHRIFISVSGGDAA